MIPKLIQLHDFWGDGATDVNETAKRYQSIMPSYDVRVYNEVPKGFSADGWGGLLDVDLPSRLLADVVRYWMLMTFGGFYVDADTIPLRPFDTLLDHGAFVSSDTGTPYFCFAGSPIGEQVWKKALKLCLGKRYPRKRHYNIASTWSALSSEVAMLPQSAVSDRFHEWPSVDAYIIHKYQSIDMDTTPDLAAGPRCAGCREL